MNRQSHLLKGHPTVLLNGQKDDAYVLLQDWLEETTGNAIYDCDGGEFTEVDQENTEYTLYSVSFYKHEEPKDVIIHVAGQMNGDIFEITNLELKK